METTVCPIVLVVEDEPLIRLDVAMALVDVGFRVYEARNADEAADILAKCDDIRLLLTDIEMSGSMDGLALAHHTRTQWPNIKIFVASGRGSPAPQHLPEQAIFINKPYRIDQIVRAFRATEK